MNDAKPSLRNVERNEMGLFSIAINLVSDYARRWGRVLLW